MSRREALARDAGRRGAPIQPRRALYRAQERWPRATTGARPRARSPCEKTRASEARTGATRTKGVTFMAPARRTRPPRARRGRAQARAHAHAQAARGGASPPGRSGSLRERLGGFRRETRRKERAAPGSDTGGAPSAPDPRGSAPATARPASRRRPAARATPSRPRSATMPTRPPWRSRRASSATFARRPRRQCAARVFRGEPHDELPGDDGFGGGFDGYDDDDDFGGGSRTTAHFGGDGVGVERFLATGKRRGSGAWWMAGTTRLRGAWTGKRKRPARLGPRRPAGTPHKLERARAWRSGRVRALAGAARGTTRRGRERQAHPPEQPRRARGLCSTGAARRSRTRACTSRCRRWRR